MTLTTQGIVFSEYHLNSGYAGSFFSRTLLNTPKRVTTTGLNLVNYGTKKLRKYDANHHRTHNNLLRHIRFVDNGAVNTVSEAGGDGIVCNGLIPVCFVDSNNDS
jgi:hypothetical protein